MRDLHQLDSYRITDPAALARFGGWAGDHARGSFTVKSPIDGAIMVIVAGNGEGWDHVSVSRKNRVPNWAEMSHVYRLFFKPDEVAMQLHVPVDAHVNIHPYVLHLWRPHATDIPLPPRSFV